MRLQVAPRCHTAAFPRDLEMDNKYPVKIPLRADLAADPLRVAAPPMAQPARSPRETLANLTAQMLSAMHNASTAGAARAAETGDWAAAARSPPPRAGAEWQNEVLTVFDRAVEQVQWANAMDSSSAGTHAMGGGFAQPPCQAATRNTRALHSLRRELLGLLDACPARPDAGRPQAADPEYWSLGLQREAAAQLGARQPPPQFPPRAGQTAPPHRGSQHGDAARPANRGKRGGAGAGRPAGSQPGPGPAAQPGGGPRRPPTTTPRQAHNLSSSLQQLSGENQDCIVIVRRINKLGFKGVPKLTRYFSSFGQVVRVLVAHSHTLTSREQADGSKLADTSQRPSSLGFVLMAAPEAARAVLAQGPEQEVEGVAIRVQRFEHKSCQDEEQVVAAPHMPAGPVASPNSHSSGSSSSSSSALSHPATSTNVDHRRRKAQAARPGGGVRSPAGSEEKAGLSEASTQ